MFLSQQKNLFESPMPDGVGNDCFDKGFDPILSINNVKTIGHGCRFLHLNQPF